MLTRIVLADDINQLVSIVGLDELMDQMTSRLFKVLRDFDSSLYELPARDGFHYTDPHVGLVEWMPVMKKGEAATIKIVGYHPENPSLKGLPTILSTVGLYDTGNGHMVGLADATFLTALRTAAASTVASQALARKESSVLGIIGVGAQAVAQLHGLCRQFPIQQVLIHDVDHKVIQSFSSRMQGLIPKHIVIKSVPIELIVQSANILCTCTSVGVGQAPLFDDIGVKSDLHINAVGADFPGKTELPLSLLHRSLVIPDFTEQAIKEGECQKMDRDKIGADLSTVLKSPEKFSFAQKEISIFDSTGYALEDQVAMAMLLEYCDDLNLGLNVQLESAKGDPRNPYDFEQSASDGVVVRL